ncbi:hypothetical protein COU78_01565 [Candidatus Peregrinibacteria bacterium CG10_big_fil_rev_8_21_14_0_10_49_24]|nr:MAG: hypothetical protein COU78_01565 [Candidatus Peregrinibacteria bacterium CG10_big_fil_rev_8_21_14_0_10_49_24]
MTSRSLYLILLAVSGTLFVLLVVNLPAEPAQPIQTPLQAQEQAASTKTADIDNSIPMPEYTIVYTIHTQRYDSGTSYYVLIPAVDITSDVFKEEVRMLVRKIAAEKGGAVSIEFHDSRQSLDLSYKQYGDQSLGRPVTQGERDILARHFIASFDGELDTGIYRNTLMFFPSAFRQHPSVGEHVASEEFNP